MARVRILPALLLALAAAVLLPPPAAATNIAAQPWAHLYGDLSVQPVRRGRGQEIAIPRSGSVNYLTTQRQRVAMRRAPRPSSRLIIQGRVIASAGARVTANLDGSNPGGQRPNFRPYLGRDMVHEHSRWWSSESVPLQRGPYRLSVRLRPGDWSSVYGATGDSSAAARAGFRAALRRPAFIGVTFGGGSYYGHGVRCTRGSARVRIDRYVFRR